MNQDEFIVCFDLRVLPAVCFSILINGIQSVDCNLISMILFNEFCVKLVMSLLFLSYCDSKDYYCRCISLLVVKDDVRQPDVFRGHVELFHASVLQRIPFELVVFPFLDNQ